MRVPHFKLTILVAVLLAFPLALWVANATLGAQTPAAPRAWTAADGPHTVMHAFVRAPWGTVYVGSSLGVYSSDDAGATWQPFGRGYPRTASEAWGVTALRTSGGDEVLAAAGDGYIYRAPRAGGAWTRAGGQIGTTGAFTLFALPTPSAVLAGSDRGIFRSSDGGHSWRLVCATPNGAVTAFARGPGGALYAGLAGLPHPLRVSTDGGYSWHTPSEPLPPPSVEALLEQSGRLYAGVMQAPGGQAVWTDNKGGFTQLTAGLPHISHGMALAAAGNRLLVGTMGVGVYSRTAGGAWTRLGQGPGDATVTSLLALPGKTPVLLAGTGDGIYRIQL